MKSNSLELYLSLIAKLIDASCDISSKLSSDGFLLLREDFGGLAGGKLSREEIDIELEILKARFATQNVPDGMGVVIRGYESKFVIPFLRSHGLSLDVLEDLARPKEVDAVIENAHLFQRYTRLNLEKRRGMEFSSAVRVQKSIEACGLKCSDKQNMIDAESSDVSNNFFDVIDLISSVFNKFGFELRKSKRSRRFATFLVDFSDVGPFQLSFTIERNILCALPLRLDSYIMPVNKFVHDMNGLSVSQRSAARPLWPLVPNFGIYRVAMNFDEIGLLKVAHEKLLSYLIPIFRSASF